jgi:orotate phosphoribosyltransferase
MTTMMTISQQIARILLRSRAVALRPTDPFRFASGLLSPIYCDNRVLISLPRQRRTVTRCFAGLLLSEAIPVDVVAGTATAGIPHAAWLAAELRLPMVYVRGLGKGHGKEQLVEGLLAAGQRTIVVEDLVTTGGSSLSSVAALRQAGAVVEHVVAIFTYAFSSTAASFAQASVQLHALTTLPILLDVAVREHYLSPAERNLVVEWANDPTGWSNAREQPQQ